MYLINMGKMSKEIAGPGVEGTGTNAQKSIWR